MPATPSHTPAIDRLYRQIDGQIHRMTMPLAGRRSVDTTLSALAAMHRLYAEHPGQPLTTDYDHDQLLTRAQHLLAGLLAERAHLEHEATRDARLDAQESRMHAAKVAHAEVAYYEAEARRVGLAAR